MMKGKRKEGKKRRKKERKGGGGREKSIRGRILTISVLKGEKKNISLNLYGTYLGEKCNFGKGGGGRI